MFSVIGKTSVSNISKLVKTNHCNNDRGNRINNIIDKIGGYGEGRYSFIVDTNHSNGLEIHTITNNGIIIIQNAESKRYVTCLIARAGQIKRYFDNGIIPIEAYKIINIAEEHRQKGWNNW